MARFWCVHCQKLIVTGKNFAFKGDAIDCKCPFCKARGMDIFSVKKSGIKVPIGKKHGDNIGYPERM